jgi:hypothetical protein
MTTVIFDISMSLDGFETASGVRPAEPLALSETNPRYFTVAAGDATDRRAVYLTGSHVNNNFHDGPVLGLIAPRLRSGTTSAATSSSSRSACKSPSTAMVS